MNNLKTDLMKTNTLMTVQECVEKASQFEIGDSVYMWDFYSGAVARSVSAPHDPIRGEVTGIEEFGKVRLYTPEGISFLGSSSHVFLCGTGPEVGE